MQRRLPVSNRMKPQQVRHGKAHKPKAYNRRANGKHDLTEASVVRMGRIAAPDSKKLPEKASDKNCAADNEGKPRHGLSFYTSPYTIGKWLLLTRQNV